MSPSDVRDRPLRLLYICHESLPSAHTNTEQIVQTSAALARAGIQVELICPAPAHPGPRDDRQAIVGQYYGLPDHAFDDGFRIVECPAPSVVGGKAVRPWLDVRASIHARRAGCYDVVYTRDPFPLVTGLLSGAPVVFETYRLDVNTRRRYWPWRAWCYRRPNLVGVVTHSHLARASFLRAGFAPARVLVAHNGYAPQEPESRIDRRDTRAALGIEGDEPVITYAGHVAPRKGMEILVQIARRVPQARFLIVGHVEHSPEAAWLARSIEAAGVKNVTLIPRTPPSETDRYLQAADCLVIPPSSRPLEAHGRTVLPLKTFRYLAAGKPIVAPDLPDVREVLQHDRNAVLVPSDDPDAAARELGHLLADGARRDRLARAACADARAYTWQARGLSIATFLRRVLAEGSRENGGVALPVG